MRICLSVAILMAATWVPSAAADERCSAIVGEYGALTYEPLPGYVILGLPPPYATPATANGPLRGISCLRDALTLALDDYRVVTDLGVPFTVSAYYTKDEDRVLLLEISDGVVAAHIIDGGLSPEERAHLELVVEQMQSAVDARNAR